MSHNIVDNRLKTVLYLVGAVVVLLAIRLGIAAVNKPDDQKLIRQALQTSIEASKEGRPGGVMDFISDKIKINNTDPGGRSQIAKFIKDGRPDIKIANQQAIITGDEARIVSPVQVKFEFLGQSVDRQLSQATLTFRKEDATEYLVVPTTKWRLVNVEIPDQSIYEFLQ